MVQPKPVEKYGHWGRDVSPFEGFAKYKSHVFIQFLGKGWFNSDHFVGPWKLNGWFCQILDIIRWLECLFSWVPRLVNEGDTPFSQAMSKVDGFFTTMNVCSDFWACWLLGVSFSTVKLDGFLMDHHSYTFLFWSALYFLEVFHILHCV